MTIRNLLISSTIAISCLAAAAYADAAKADDGNPYTPEPAASTETADHGQSTYCTVRPLGAIWSCTGLELVNGEGPNKGGLEAREGKHHVDPKPVKDECDHGPKGEGGGGSPDGAGRSSVRS